MVRSDNSFASVIRVNIALLRLSGVVSYENGSIHQSSSQNILRAIAYGCLFAYAGLYTYEFVLHTIYLDTWMESFAMILSLVGGQARFTILLLFRNRFQRLLAICEELWTTLNATEKKHVRNYVKTTRHLTYYYLFSCAFTIFFYALANLFVVQYDDALNATIRTLPYTCPVKVHRSPYYEIMYIVQLCSMIHVGLTCAGADTVGPVLVLTICGHFKVLNVRILHLNDHDRVHSEGSSSASTKSLGIIHEENDRSKNHVKSNLEACVYYHQTMFKLCKEVESLTTSIFLTQLLGSTYNVSLVGFKLAGNYNFIKLFKYVINDLICHSIVYKHFKYITSYMSILQDDPDKFKYATQLLIAVIQLFLSNWAANVLVIESQDVAKAIYFTPWYRFSYQLKRSVNIIIMRSQKPAQLTAGNIIPLSLQTFASVRISVTCKEHALFVNLVYLT
ncbi:Odorant receptor 49b [Cyphomyrmex costatus]|uniref:Odorant receptor n=1 Tax=Cyphomyrmex costatus TaxID=456900 RepID=A0A151ILY7_9HYME|nr:Odorant receptor 49b [Cyphomyrmex costatus]